MIDSISLQSQVKDFLDHPKILYPDNALCLLQQCYEAIKQLNQKVICEQSRNKLLQQEVNLSKEMIERIQQRLTAERARANCLQDEANLAFELLQKDIDDLR